MFQKLVSHNEDILRLVEKGVAVAFDGAHMIVRDVPYLDSERKLQWGTIVSKLVFVDQLRIIQDDHQIFFAGGVPHEIDGTPIKNLAGGPHTLALGATSSDVLVQRSFSNKPVATGKFENFFDKIESYVALISGPAMSLHGASPYTFRTQEDSAQHSVFKFHDTLTSRAELSDLAKKFENDVIGIVGLGGTGAYLLDFLVKTPVREIRAFDLDPYHVHNAFRSPGKLDEDELGRSKAEVYASRYSNFRHGLTVNGRFIDASCAEDFDGVTFAFVCVDKGSSRADIFDLLIAKGIPFIDVGMGLSRNKDGALKGMVRTTYFSVDDAERMRDEELVETGDGADNLYKTNIQISELNALNASLAVILYKQLRGFYVAQESHYHLLFDLLDLKIVGSSFPNAN